MPLSHEDWIDVLTHTRRRVREAGFGDLDERVTLDFRSTQSPPVDFLRYLDSLISAVGERSYSTYQRTMDIFQQSMSTESGRPVEGIEVQIEDTDRAVYGADRVDLSDSEDLSEVLDALKRLRADIGDLVDEQGST